MELQRLIEDKPKFQKTIQGEPVFHGLSQDVLSYIADHLGRESNTLETGAGLSTVLFAFLGTRHIAITPNPREVDRISAYCRQHEIALDNVTFVTERSETAMPRLSERGLDLVLIDGNHSFPAPFIDYYYAVERTKVGGLLIVDDTQLWTGRILRDFLLLEPEWRLSREFLRTVSFRKVKEGGHLKKWAVQPYVKKHSNRYIWEYRWSIMWRQWLYTVLRIIRR
jgi:Methyltransferase domain